MRAPPCYALGRALDIDKLPVLSELKVVLVAPRNPLNIGAAARAMSNFGAGSLRLVNPYHVAYQEARSAVHAGHILKDSREYPTLAEAVADCSLVVGTTALGPRELEHPLRRLEYGARLIRKRLVSAPVALLFGSEKFGLSNEDLSHCHWLMRIPTREAHRSMNLGQAVAICLYELARSTAAASTKPEPRQAASADQLELFTTLLLEVLERSGYVQPRVTASTRLKVRRLIRRMGPSAHDAEIWLGMLRQIRWKIEQCYPGAE